MKMLKQRLKRYYFALSSTKHKLYRHAFCYFGMPMTLWRKRWYGGFDVTHDMLASIGFSTLERIVEQAKQDKTQGTFEYKSLAQLYVELVNERLRGRAQTWRSIWEEFKSRSPRR